MLSSEIGDSVSVISVEVLHGWTGWRGRHPISYSVRRNEQRSVKCIAEQNAAGSYLDFVVRTVEEESDSALARCRTVFPSSWCSRYRERYNSRISVGNRSSIHLRMSSTPLFLISGLRMRFHPFAEKTVLDSASTITDNSGGARLKLCFEGLEIDHRLAVGVSYYLLQLKNGN